MPLDGLQAMVNVLCVLGPMVAIYLKEPSVHAFGQIASNHASIHRTSTTPIAICQDQRGYACGCAAGIGGNDLCARTLYEPSGQ